MYIVHKLRLSAITMQLNNNVYLVGNHRYGMFIIFLIRLDDFIF